MPQFFGFDHIDVRVRSLAAVEAFYDRLMPELGMPQKTYSFVDSDGTWHDARERETYNTVEYHETALPGAVAHFIGFIEDPAMRPTFTRIAFRVPSPADVIRWEERLRGYGAVGIERDEDFEHYPAIFFADPAGTLLEICARHLRTLT